MAVVDESSRRLRSFSDSCDFRESRVISDSKITRRRKNYKRKEVPSDDTTVPDSFLSDNSFKAESARENGTYVEKELLSSTKNEERIERYFDDTLVHTEATSKVHKLGKNVKRREDLEKIKDSTDKVFFDMANNCKDRKSLVYFCNTVASFCAFVYQNSR
uniref:WAPL domain-containing protein n=1 Tax=Strongyloides papillosus TaxID=174720 RepID=A0A0N5CFN3_STREA